MARKILVILGHPQHGSLCGALADAYAEGAEAAGHDVRRIAVGDLDFDPLRPGGYDRPMALEPDLERAQQDILWADHLVWVYPNWWGTMPALMKGFIDRAFLPGFAFRYRGGRSPWWDRLLAGRSARLLVTMDSPSWWYRWVVRQPGHNEMRRSVLGFCGVKPVRTTSFGPVRGSDDARRARWIAAALDLGGTGA